MMIAEYEAYILAQLDEMVEEASDDELFAGGYLRGHVTLAASIAEERGENTLDELSAHVVASLENAIKAGELSPPDQALVHNLWLQLYQKIAVNWETSSL